MYFIKSCVFAGKKMFFDNIRNRDLPFTLLSLKLPSRPDSVYKINDYYKKSQQWEDQITIQKI